MRFRTIIVFCVLPVLGTVLGITATAQHCTIGELSVSGLRHSSVESRSVWNDLLSSASSTFGARPGLRGEGPSETPLQSESPVAERPPRAFGAPDSGVGDIALRLFRHSEQGNELRHAVEKRADNESLVIPARAMRAHARPRPPV